LEATKIAADLVRTLPAGRLTAKGDRDMASEVDFAVERAVRRFLAWRTPTIGFVGEEEGIHGASAELVWTLDPIDGTANFVRSLPLCAVSLALVARSRPVLGVVDLPFLSARYSAVDGEGAQVNGRTLNSSKTSSLGDAVVSIGDYAVGVNAPERNRLRLALTERLAARVQRVRMFGSVAVDLVWLAEGKTDVSITLSNKPWDTAAGVVIAREAGAKVVDLDGSPHTVNSSATIAVAEPLLAEVLKLMSQLD
jgi:myo-inositol-1(or 4)-monophosphatase